MYKGTVFHVRGSSGDIKNLITAEGRRSANKK